MFIQLIMIGRLGKDPVMTFTPDGNPITNFSIACDVYKGRNEAGEPKKETMWLNVATFGKLAENCNSYLAKGKLVQVAGKLNFDPATGGPRTYTKADGTKGASFDLVANEVTFLSPKDS